MDSTSVPSKPPATQKRVRKILRAVAYVTIALVVICLVSVRLALPHINKFRPQIAHLVSEFVGQTVSIGNLEAQWRGWKTVELRMEKVGLLNEAGNDTVLELKRARVTIDIITTLLNSELQPGNLVVSGARIALIREADGTFAAQGLEDNEDTPATPDASSTQREAYANWLLTQEELDLESATIIWQDQRAGRPPLTLTDVNVHTRFDGLARHQVRGSATLPAEIGKILGFDIDVTGDPLSRDWSGSLSFRADDIHLGALSNIHRSLGLTGAAGRVSIDLDTQWAKTRLINATGHFRLANTQLQWSRGVSHVESAAGRFQLERDKDSWMFDLQQDEFVSGHGNWPPMEARFKFEASEGAQTASTFSADITFARIEDLMPLAGRFGPRKLRAALGQIPLQGDLENLHILASRIDDELIDLDITTSVRDVSIPARGQTPGVSGISGKFQADLFEGQFTLDSTTLGVTIPGVFSEPLNLSNSAGEISWKRRGTGWWLETSGLALTNDEVAGTLVGKVHWPYGNTLPILDMGVHIERADLTRVDTFAPVELLRPRFAAWMRRAIKGGEMKNAHFWYRGYAGDFPFDSGDGGIQADGEIHDLEMAYSTRWPIVTQMQGTFSVTGKALDLTASSGQVLGSVIDSGTASIPNLSVNLPTLHIETNLSGKAETGLRFIREGALATRFGNFATALTANGDIKVNLKIVVPLPDGKKKAQGTITLLGNDLSLNEVDINLTQTKGELTFSPDGMRATAVESLYLGSPINIDVLRNTGKTELVIRGQADKDFLLRQLHGLALFADPADPLRILSHIGGSTHWHANVSLPDRWGSSGEPAQLRVASDLQGLSLGLPAPFGKPAEEIKHLVIDTSFFAGADRNVKIRYGPDIGSQFELKPDKDGYLMTRGAVVFGDPSPDLPTRPGLFVGGQLARLSIDHWSEIVTEPERTATSSEPTDYPILRVLKEVEIRTDELELLGNVFDTARIDIAKNQDDQWSVRVRGNSIDGVVVFPPPERRGEPVVIELDQLRLSKIEEQSKSPNRFDPRAFPPLKFSARHIIYDDLNIGAIKFSTTPHPDGLSVDSLLLLSEGFEASSVGTWTLIDGAHRSAFVSDLHADELNQLLCTLGHADETAEGGATDILMNLSWPGSPSQFSMKTMSGIVQLRASRGRLLDINPGATGRLVGFLMMASLPRRLKLDFSDIFDEGLVYEYIEGSFAIEGGHAYTNNLRVESEAAKIEIAGRTGLIAKNYDQVVTITPKLASSLPLAPVWLLEKVLQRQVFDKVFSYQYTVTGDWADPLIERVSIDSESKTDDEQAER